ncbi:hypothetical protein H112_04745 [Trichophyton rubrum D6]|uniref:ceramidase n=4 Tax=Trichophyton TaxID=5550 RepID=A0A178F5J0_TRIRU|nr:uncharacterized protein TERG_04509 [Trichophyton rubrum CBS 118892]EZF22288.1 hypothetical protein H100_04753 [Trichophyton rubrum MR850]EZF41437.1 hypothetical protein H102_04741 [Trichophyton rubrum CBS 100081]EZF52012.1 hypothetical protein H103_04746 [Trichophyton rubrum CBS 288.86]EZF62668.1 hypothetical protein H104_04732 [Trichophyton rubrum CBS 289.86]EZF73292.1 hypothetical protein H105_04763 [Trichophyton soudanense CBS 452.61]EZF83916.1 hypothetical protein H110_04742 [Trichophy
MARPRELGDIPPTFRIDLSLPPSERYVVLASLYRQRLRSLIDIFEELVSSLDGIISQKWVYRVAPILLRKLYTREETEEIKGISRATGIDLYILVSLNVFLDLLMGCTSGAVLTKLPHDTDSKMLHFRTLDWDMDDLRRLIVKLEYVRGLESNTVIATSVTYVGFVGVLTGVRRGLSISLNFRPNHNSGRFLANYRFYGSHLLVLLGMRRSISSLLRKYILSPDLDHIRSRPWLDRILWRKRSRIPSKTTLDWIAENLPRVPTTAAYLIMCDGNSAIVFEKDHRSAVIQESSSFVVATNSDLARVSLASQKEEAVEYDKGHDDRIIDTSNEPLDLDDLIFLSGERRAHMQGAWEKKVKQKQEKPSTSHDYSTAEPILSQSGCQSGPTVDCCLNVSLDLCGDNQVAAMPSEVTEWINGYPVTNEMTHFAAIMDPTLGQVVWLRRYLEPPTHNDNC